MDSQKAASWLCSARWPKLIASLVLVITVNTSRAAVYTDYTDASTFAAALQPGNYLNDFTGAGSGDSLVYSGGAAPFAYRITSTASNGVSGVNMATASGLGRAVSTFVENDVLTITFTANKPTAIGGNFFWTALADPSDVISGTITAAFKIDGLTVHSFDVTSTGNSSIGFGGVTTDGTPFDSVEFTLKDYTSGFFFPTVDNFNIGLVTPIPEPGGWIAAAFSSLFVLGGLTRSGWRFVCRRRAAKA